MRATIAAIVLAVATGCLGWIWGDRNKIVNHPDPVLYQPALYSLHVRAVESVGKAPVKFQLDWDVDKVSRLGKGSEPAVIQEFADGSVAAQVVGHPLPEGLIFEVKADGYETKTIPVQGSGGGIRYSLPSHVVTVELVKSPAGAASQD